MSCKLLSEFLRTYIPRLILEVFGAGGAIWGFSEAIGFRTPKTVWFWRPAALIVGIIFFIRWVIQIYYFVDGMNNPKRYKQPGHVAPEQDGVNLTSNKLPEEETIPIFSPVGDFEDRHGLSIVDEENGRERISVPEPLTAPTRWQTT